MKIRLLASIDPTEILTNGCTIKYRLELLEIQRIFSRFSSFYSIGCYQFILRAIRGTYDGEVFDVSAVLVIFEKGH